MRPILKHQSFSIEGKDLKGKRKIKMSVFAAAAMALPPGYSSTTRQPPPAYKQGVSQPLTAPSLPPPVYKTTRSTTTTISLRSSLSTITSLELPQYTSIISAPRPKSPPSATCQSTSSAPTWKDPYVETDVADSVYELEQRNSRQREQQQQQEEDDSMKNWCWGCFWWYFHVPAGANGIHPSAYGAYIFWGYRPYHPLIGTDEDWLSEDVWLYDHLYSIESGNANDLVSRIMTP